MHKKSFHPWHTNKAIPFSQALRIRRICSDENIFQSRLAYLKGWFKGRGYEAYFVQQQIGRVRGLDREVLINARDKQEDQEREGRVPLVTTYHKAITSMIGVANRLHPMLITPEKHRKVFPEPPFHSI